MHPDHTGGLVPLIFYRNILRIVSKLTIYGPTNLKKYLMDSYKHQGLNLKFELEIHNIENHENIELENGITVSSVEFIHKIPCLGYKFKDEKKSVLFITDSLPCDNVIKFAKNCTHFIHEATFTGEHKDLALETKHTTISQAIEIGKKANVKQIYLTHFSPRISDEEITKLENEFEFMGLNNKKNYNLITSPTPISFL